MIVGSVGKSAGFPMGGPVFEPSGQRDAPGFNNPRGVEVMEFALNPSYIAKRVVKIFSLNLPWGRVCPLCGARTRVARVKNE